MLENGHIAALDIGTTKICCVIAAPDENGGANVLGIGNSQSHGMSRGRVTNVDRTVNAIKVAVNDAQHMAGVKAGSVMLGVSGGTVECFNKTGIVGVRDSKNKIITEEDKRRAMESAVAGDIPKDRETVHTLVQEYAVDGQQGIKDPLGMMGMRLEVGMHVSTVSLSALQNVLNCARQAGLVVEDENVVLESVASAEAVLTPEEIGMGVAVLDFGGGTADMGIFANGCVRHTAVINLGGDHLTNDIVKALKIPMLDAEKLKIAEGCCLTSMLADPEEVISAVCGNGMTTEVGRGVFCDILESRVEEIMTLAHLEIAKSGYDAQVMEIVVTGGSSLLSGIPELARDIFDRPVRIGYPAHMGGFSQMISCPRFSTAVGLILYGIRLHGAYPELSRDARSERGFLGNIFGRLFGG
ncbi:MAG: cell division protein FtsA [Deltaproteobacteria bacterium]|jgi:cell division protein FtsA|nr:cell division protein FtsA [Deltaproteobacteria bacterium]